MWLKCTPPDKVNTSKGKKSGAARLTAAGVYHWHHQAFEPLLAAFEFRVVMDQDGRAGGVVLTTVGMDMETKDNRISTKCMVLENWTETLRNLHPPSGLDLGYYDLIDFAEFTYHQLRGLRHNLATADEHFSSLDVGVRLDVGIHVDDPSVSPPKARFFVNEITRIWEADMFVGQVELPPYCEGRVKSMATALLDKVDW